ncbi:hypothetical protein CBS101457_003237 [Exobasidium rhododendri]|nr:hypothetical protein CBS101457_003237 [Exobasidium rhododendri]
MTKDSIQRLYEDYTLEYRKAARESNEHRKTVAKAWKEYLKKQYQFQGGKVEDLSRESSPSSSPQRGERASRSSPDTHIVDTELDLSERSTANRDVGVRMSIQDLQKEYTEAEESLFNARAIKSEKYIEIAEYYKDYFKEQAEQQGYKLDLMVSTVPPSSLAS